MIDNNISTIKVDSAVPKSDEVDKLSKRDQRAAKRNRSENEEKSCNTSTPDDMEEDMSVCDGTVNVTTVTDLRSLLNKGKQGLPSRVVKKNGNNLSITLKKCQSVSPVASTKQIIVLSPNSLIRQAILESNIGKECKFFFGKKYFVPLRN